MLSIQSYTLDPQPEMLRVKSAAAKSNLISPVNKTKLSKTMFTSNIETINGTDSTFDTTTVSIC